MRRFLTSIIALLMIFVVGDVVAQQNPVSWSSSVEAQQDGSYTITLRAEITPPWHLYDMGPYVGGPNATIINFAPSSDYTLNGGVVQVSEPTILFDPMFEMEIGFFSNEAIFAQNITLNGGVSGAEVEVNVEWMCCDDQSCTPPDDLTLSIEVGEVTDKVASDVDIVEAVSISSNVLRGKSLWGAILEAILWGFAALLTPCVFPMIPMTVSFFLKQSGKRGAKLTALLFGLSIVALYTVPIAVIIAITKIVGGEAVTSDVFSWLSTHWLPNIIFFVVFMLFAISFFGGFEMKMPSRLVNSSDSNADRGGIIGILFMALTLVLVSFSCTGPIVGSVLISSTSGAVWAPVITMIAFSAAFALPFTLFALFPALLKKLPKSGSWLSSVKIVLGFVELALGLKFLSIADQTYHWRLLDREIYLALWIVIFTLLGLYLLGKLRFAHDKKRDHTSVTGLMLSIVVFTFVVYMIPGMFGAPLKGISGYLPPLRTQDFVAQGRTLISESLQDDDFEKPKYSDFLSMPHGLRGFFTLEEGLAYGAKVGKPIFVSYTGHGCVNCREMEAKVWSDSKVLNMLNDDFVIVMLYSDDKKQLPEEDWITTSNGRVLKTLGKINVYKTHRRYGINSQPYYMILNDKGEQLVEGRGYRPSISGFVNFLEGGIEAFNNQK